MENIIQFSTAGIALILAIITDRFFKDPVVEKPVYNRRRMSWVVLVYILAFAVVLYWSWLAIKGVPSEKLAGSWPDILPQLGLIAIIFLIQLFVEKVEARSFGFCTPKNWWVLVLPLIFFFGSSLLNISWAREIKISVFIGGMLLVITEEILFRGFIQNELERTFGIRYMWIIAGILFGLWHVPTDFWGYQFLHKGSYLYSFGQLAMQISGGLWACAVYKKTRSVYPLILFHWVGNNYHIHLFYTIKNLF
ncbi:MAG: CPBP family intramembrane metalloprotease [Candidatus Aminicenantes bacterium]|nr:CPBP family intramembrane metalloprotease [Candidatus Aminicenantes bacterium]